MVKLSQQINIKCDASDIMYFFCKDLALAYENKRKESVKSNQKCEQENFPFDFIARRGSLFETEIFKYQDYRIGSNNIINTNPN